MFDLPGLSRLFRKLAQRRRHEERSDEGSASDEGSRTPELLALRKRIETGAVPMPDDVRAGIVDRIDDLIGFLDGGREAIERNGADNVGTAAAKLAMCSYSTGNAWRRYLAQASLPAAVREDVARALTADAGPLRSAFAARLGPPGDAVCAACATTDDLARCDDCGRTWCADHSRREEVWSGSWLESTLGHCPLGHEWEIS